MNVLRTTHGELSLPVFLPDATRGVVRTIDADDLQTSGVTGVMVNALHLMSHPGMSVISSLGGIHRFMGWTGPVISDSGGFQVFSLIEKSRKLGSVTQRGFTYRMDSRQEKKNLTPEKCIQKQFQLGSDIVFCLDYCTHPGWEKQLQEKSVKYTVDWAKRCKEEYRRQMEQRERPAPSIFAVVQGGNSHELRRQCAHALLEEGFDGYGFGGWPVNDKGELTDMVECVANLIPDEYPRHALGIGKPENVVSAFFMGYTLFDCSIPTRDARRKRLYVFNAPPETIDIRENPFYKYLYLQDEKYVKDACPVDESCDCYCCRTYSRAYLYHLFRVEEYLAYRLATIHNLRFYARLMKHLRHITRTP